MTKLFLRKILRSYVSSGWWATFSSTILCCGAIISTKDELKALINAIDRGSPKGKREYAIILLACSLGLRCTDIKQLKTENFHWEEKKLVLTQSKTKEPLVLPLIPEVGWAVIEYLRYGRPKVDSSYIFIRHTAPFLPFSEGDHLNQLIKQYMVEAHLPTLKKRRGMHSLRHYVEPQVMGSGHPKTPFLGLFS